MKIKKNAFFGIIAIVVVCIGILAYPEFNRRFLSCSNCDFEVLELSIHIDDSNLDSLILMRNRAITRGKILRTEKKYIEADINWEGKKHDVSLRLKGDLLDHLNGERWSFRIKTPDNEKIIGLEKFSLQDPSTRGNIHEWIFHQILKNEDIIHLHYDFVKVFLNEEYKGVYAFEEHFNKELIEHNERPSGIIASFSEDEFWNQIIIKEFDSIYDTDMFLQSRVKFYSKVHEFKPEIFQEVEAKLKSWRKGDILTCDIFNCEMLSSYLALCDLTNAKHALRWHNMKFYYNAETSKFELIGFDANGGVTLEDLMINNQYLNKTHRKNIFNDDRLVKLYFEQLDRVSNPGYLDSVFEELHDDLCCNLSLIWENDENVEFSKRLYYLNQEIIRDKIEEYKLE